MAFDGTLKFDTGIDKSGFESDIGKLGAIAAKGMKAVTKVVTASVAAAAGGLSVLGAKALTAYADYEQLAGGVATLFGAQDMSLEAYAQSVGKSVDAVKGEYDNLIAAQDAVMQNAAAAFQTAGLSQNEYMETVTSFSAALIASLDGDTAKAAQVADRAIVDMADNANKMGSSMESIQNAYQGFAKQNYTMLDNLKLGYGGTKSEMERLLADAQKISGVKYNLESYADIVEAIHVIQSEMHISGISAEEAAELVASGALTEEEAFSRMGTTAKESAATIQGSVSAAKASFSNLLLGISDDTQDFEKLIDAFVGSAATAAENILPRVETIIGGIGKLISSMSGVAADLIVDLTAYLPDLIGAGVSMIGSIAEGLKENAPAIAKATMDAGKKLLGGIIDIGGDLLELGGTLLMTLAEGISENLPELLHTVSDMIAMLADGISEALPQILSLGAEILFKLIAGLETCLPQLVSSAAKIVPQLVRGITSKLPELIKAASRVILTFAKSLADAIPKVLPEVVSAALSLAEALTDPSVISDLIDAAITLVIALADGLIDALPQLIERAPVIIQNLVDALVQNAPKLLNAAIEIIAKLAEALTDPATLIALGEAAWEIIKSLIVGITDVLGELVYIGADILEAIWDGILENLGKAAEWAGEILSGFLDALAAGWHDIIDAGGKIIGWIAEGIGNVFKTAWEWGESLINGIIDSIALAWKYLVDAGSSIIGWIVDGIGNLWDAGKQWINDIWDGMKAAWGDFWDWLKARGKDILSALNPLNWVGTVAESDAVQNMIDSMQKKTGELDKTSSEIAQIPADYLHHSTPKKGAMQDDDVWGSDFVQNIIAGMEQKRGELEKAAEEIAKIPADYLHHTVPDKGPLHDDDQWGSEFAKNLIDGIRSRQQDAEKVVRALADGIADAIRFLKDDAYRWGLDMMYGLANGISGGISAVQNAAAAAANSIAAYLHFSRPEKGALHDYERWMPDFLSGLAGGIYGHLPTVSAAARALSAAMRPEIPSYTPDTVQALRTQSARSNDGIPSLPGTASIIHNSYSTVNNHTVTEQTQPVINVYLTAEMDGEKVAELTASKVDVLQGETIAFDERGTAH